VLVLHHNHKALKETNTAFPCPFLAKLYPRKFFWGGAKFGHIHILGNFLGQSFGKFGRHLGKIWTNWINLGETCAKVIKIWANFD